jgi:hypothetical protein
LKRFENRHQANSRWILVFTLPGICGCFAFIRLQFLRNHPKMWAQKPGNAALEYQANLQFDRNSILGRQVDFYFFTFFL